MPNLLAFHKTSAEISHSETLTPLQGRDQQRHWKLSTGNYECLSNPASKCGDNSLDKLTMNEGKGITESLELIFRSINIDVCYK